MSRFRAKTRFCENILKPLQRPLGFVDVGSGGPLKHPWSLLPRSHIRKLDVDPETSNDSQPVCISDSEGEADFHIAADPRASSLHPPNEDFISRFGATGMRIARTIRVRTKPLTAVIDGLASVDVMDINVEGHDARVLRGAVPLFKHNFVKLLKIEYELAQAWHGQSWFADIDPIMRELGYELAAMENEHAKPTSIQTLRVTGEPVWGKAVYVPSAESWNARASAVSAQAFEEDCRIGMALYVAFDLPARALDLAGLAAARPATEGLPRTDELLNFLSSLYGTNWRRRCAAQLSRLLPARLREIAKPIALKFFGT